MVGTIYEAADGERYWLLRLFPRVWLNVMLGKRST